jgi:hypothetical protein
MTNGDLFQSIFDIYATELWSKQEAEFLEWLNSECKYPQPKIWHWIPVSERLPEADEYIGDVARYYLVQNEYGDMLVARYTHSGYWEQIYQLKSIGDEIVAWMPLPEPHVPDTNIGNISEKPIGSEPQESGGTDADSN